MNIITIEHPGLPVLDLDEAKVTTLAAAAQGLIQQIAARGELHRYDVDHLRTALVAIGADDPLAEG